MRKKIENTSTVFFVSALYLSTYSTEGYPTTEPGKALNPQAINANQPCCAQKIGDNILLSYNVGTTLTLSEFDGVCLRWPLSREKIACGEEDLSLTKCVNESSTASLCHNNTVDIYAKKNPDGNYTIFVNASKELIEKCSPVNVTAHFGGTSPDLTCYHNGPASEMGSNQTYLTEKPTRKLSAPAGTASTNSPSSFIKADPDADTPTFINSPVANFKPDPDVDTTTDLTVTPSLKPDFDAGTPTNSSTVTSSLKPHSKAGKPKVGQIVGIVLGVILVAPILTALFYYLCNKREQRRRDVNKYSANGVSITVMGVGKGKGNHETAIQTDNL